MRNNNVCKFSSVRSSDLICTDFVYETTNIMSHGSKSDNHMLGVVVSGAGNISYEGMKYPISKGSIFVVKRNKSFSIDFTSEGRYFYIGFHGRRADELMHRYELFDDVSVIDIKDDKDNFSAFGFDCLDKANENNLDILGEAMLLYVFGHFPRKKSGSQRLLSEMISATHDNFTDATFSLSTLSKTLGYDSKYLSSYFKKNKGIGYTQYLRDLRLNHSVFLIEQGVISVKNVALLSGFTDALYFSKIFKSVKGKSPKAYIEELEGESLD